MNWLHGHWNSKRGSTYYNGPGNLQYSAGSVYDWVVVCGRNTATAGAIQSIVDGITTATASGGSGGCAVGINHHEGTQWEFAEMHIWDFHLNNEDFQQAHDSMLDDKNGVQGTAFCAACPSMPHRRAPVPRRARAYAIVDTKGRTVGRAPSV